MSESKYEICFQGGDKLEAYLTKWKVKPNRRISPGTVLLLYDSDNSDFKLKNSCMLKKLKATIGGSVIRLLKAEGDKLYPGCPVLQLQPCTHSIVYKNMCADCGMDLETCPQYKQKEMMTSIPVVHSVPDLLVNSKIAMELGKADQMHLLRSRKLVLIMDLEHTLIHTSTNRVSSNLKGWVLVFVHLRHIGGLLDRISSQPAADINMQQITDKDSSRWCHAKIRPGAKEFLEKMSRLFELHICTLATKEYAHAIVKLLDEDGRYFSNRIISKDEGADFNSKARNLRNLFPRGDKMVCILDDRHDVWQFAPNFVNVKPFYFFPRPNSHILTCGLKLPDDHLQLRDTSEKKLNHDSDSQEDVAGPQTVSKHKIVTKSPKVTTKRIQRDENTYRMLQGASEGDNLVAAQGDGRQFVPDVDKYLLSLSHILVRVHKRFYQLYDVSRRRQDENGAHHVPDLKTIIPRMRTKVLRGINLVFSAVIPLEEPRQRNRFYQVAKCLGAEVQLTLTLKTKQNGRKATSHLVAARLGTSKVNEAKRMTGVHIVNPDWLWQCAARWEKVDETLFAVPEDTSAAAKHCGKVAVVLRNSLPSVPEVKSPIRIPDFSKGKEVSRKGLPSGSKKN